MFDSEKTSNPDRNFYGEIYVGILDKNNSWYQDLAIIRSEYEIDKETDEAVYHGNTYQVFVYGDKNSEGYTDEYMIPLYVEQQ